VGEIRGDTAEALRLAQEALARAEALLRVAEQTRDDVREINQRTGGAATP
jgi:hypothetical protein